MVDKGRRSRNPAVESKTSRIYFRLFFFLVRLHRHRYYKITVTLYHTHSHKRIIPVARIIYFNSDRWCLVGLVEQLCRYLVSNTHTHTHTAYHACALWIIIIWFFFTFSNYMRFSLLSAKVLDNELYLIPYNFQ